MKERILATEQKLLNPCYIALIISRHFEGHLIIFKPILVILLFISLPHLRGTILWDPWKKQTSLNKIESFYSASLKHSKEFTNQTFVR